MDHTHTHTQLPGVMLPQATLSLLYYLPVTACRGFPLCGPGPWDVYTSLVNRLCTDVGHYFKHTSIYNYVGAAADQIAEFEL